MKRTKSSPLGWYTVGIAALFFAGFLLLVIFGALIYRNAARSQSGNCDARSLTAYLTTIARANDSEDSVRIYDSEYGTVLSMADGDSGFAFRIYRYGGHLVEEYEESGAELRARPRMPSSRSETSAFVSFCMACSMLPMSPSSCVRRASSRCI